MTEHPKRRKHSLSWRSAAQDRLEGVEAGAQAGRAGLQDNGRVELEVRARGDDLLVGHKSLPGELACGAPGKDVLAAGDFDELRDPLDGADARLVPLLKVHLGAHFLPGRKGARGLQALDVAVDEL